MRAFSRWFSRRPAARRASPQRDPLSLLMGASTPAASETQDDAPPRGCAWYDSSLELRRGLQVVESPGWLQMANA